MSNNKMLIDATHPEETRVVVLRGGRVEEFDYESAARKLLRGNIYLAKVTRVEPSLQAAFIDYGGNRHGFLAFNEIHPDYYQIPMADRQALIEAEAAAEAAEEAEADARAEARARRSASRNRSGGRPQGRSSAARDAGENGEPDYSRDAPDDRDDERDERDADREDAPSHATRAEATGIIDEIVSEPPAPEVVGGFDPAAADRDTRDEEETGAGVDDAAPPAAHEAAETEPSSRGASAEGEADDGDEGNDVDEDDDQSADDESEASASGDGANGGNGEAERIEEVGTADALEEVAYRPRRRLRSYKIQEVIKRRQVILVQVVKEERGNKGAALTTYLSLAGRYTVLMPNTARGGGISRKITQPQDRKRLKAIAHELEVPEGMGLIIRTAGAARSKQEIQRDFEYLLRLWESVRDLTLRSVAPSLVYEEGNLIKRSIRDLYNKDVEEIIVAGDVAYHDAKDFMRMLMPSHAKNVIEYKEPEPLFTRFGIERQLNAMFSPYVSLPSGGYMVINQTEALVAIDINSGKSTREFSIEETALNTNLEAAEEIARQLKLRDLAGLIVIDFIDMEEKRNNRSVERRLKDSLRFDRARIQVGRISHFGLMEMSRQRLRTGVLEGSTTQCPHCQGTGIIRSTESVALAVLRGLEDQLMTGQRNALVAHTTTTVALYILNNKRTFINDMEARNGVSITVQASDKLQGANFTIEKGAAPAAQIQRPERNVVNMDWGFEGEGDDEAPAAEDATFDDEGGERRSERSERSAREGQEGRGEDGGRRRRRRRRGRGRRGERGDADQMRTGSRGDDGREDAEGEGEESYGEGAGIEEIETDMPVEVIGGEHAGEDSGEDAADLESEEGHRPGEQGNDRRGRRGRRRGRRGGRRSRERDASDRPESARAIAAEPGEEPEVNGEAHDIPGMGDQPEVTGQFPVETPRGRQRASRPRSEPLDTGAAEPAEARDEVDTAGHAAAEPIATIEPPAGAPSVDKAPEVESGEREAPAQRRPRFEPTSSEPRLERVVVKPDATAEPAPAAEAGPAQPTRRGWWSRK